MLTRLRLQGFKPWKDTGDIDLRPITGLFGTNSSGKTSVLQALLLLKQTADSPDRAPVFNFGSKTTLVDLGSFRDVAHEHDVNNILEISIDWEAQQSLKITDSKNSDRVVVDSPQMGFTIQASQRLGPKVEPVSVDQMCYRVAEAQFGMFQKSPEAESGYELFANAPNFNLVKTVGRSWPLPAPDKCYGFPAQVRAYFQNAEFVADLELKLAECLQHVYYLGPLRAYPERRYAWAGTEPSDMGRTGESVVDAILASRERGDTFRLSSRGKRLTLEQYVAHWLKKLGLIHDFRVARIAAESPVFEVWVRQSQGGAETLITEVGFGVSQILPVLVLCFYVPEGSTVILEQPEIHLHPSVQSGLADVLIDVWRKRKVQIILESHSEHLLRRLRLRVAEVKISEKDVGLYFCTATDYGACLTTLQLDSFGNIANWPTSFFGDEFSEIATMNKAVLKRRRSAAT